LFSATMVEANFRYNVNHVFAVELKDQPQHAMGSRVLRSDIEEHEIGLFTVANHSPVFRFELKVCLFFVYFFVWQLERSHFCCPGRMLFSERVTIPREWHQ